LQLLGALDSPFQGLHQLGTLAERPGEGVHSPALDQPLDRCPGHRAKVHPLAEVVEVSERPFLLPGADDLLGRPSPEAFDRHEAKEDLAVFDGEVRLPAVDVRGQHLDSELAGVGDVLD
jgi:hypothetical protein